MFRNADKQARFLRFVVVRALDDPDPAIKEFDIGVEVYGRRPDYDPRADPIVRVEASRLRARLREYYELEPPAEVRIELPKGSYIPRFEFVGNGNGTEAGGGNAVAVLPVRSLSTDPANDNFCAGLTEEILLALGRWAGIRVIAPGALARVSGGEAAAAAARYLIEGSVRRAGDQVRVTVHMVDTRDASTRFSRQYQESAANEFAVQERLATEVATEAASALGLLSLGAGRPN